jgi:hypothetical protein
LPALAGKDSDSQGKRPATSSAKLSNRHNRVLERIRCEIAQEQKLFCSVNSQQTHYRIRDAENEESPCIADML